MALETRFRTGLQIRLEALSSAFGVAGGSRRGEDPGTRQIKPTPNPSEEGNGERSRLAQPPVANPAVNAMKPARRLRKAAP